MRGFLHTAANIAASDVNQKARRQIRMCLFACARNQASPASSICATGSDLSAVWCKVPMDSRHVSRRLVRLVRLVCMRCRILPRSFCSCLFPLSAWPACNVKPETGALSVHRIRNITQTMRHKMESDSGQVLLIHPLYQQPDMRVAGC